MMIDIYNYFTEFLIIPELIKYSNTSSTSRDNFKDSKYYQECIDCMKNCDHYSIDNVIKFGNINLLRKIFMKLDLYPITIEKCILGQFDCVKFLIERVIILKCWTTHFSKQLNTDI